MLDDLIDAWLKAPPHRLALHFAPALEARFEADTGAGRCRSMAVFNAIGFLFGCLLYPVIVSSMHDVAGLARIFYLGLSMPIGFAVSAVLWLRPPAWVREGCVLLANVVCICVSLTLMAFSQHTELPLVVAGLSVLMVYSTVGIQLRFGHAVTALASIITAFAFTLHRKADIGLAEQRNLVIVTLVTACYLLLANWRLERAARRGYLLMLREKLNHDHLSRRNIELDELARRDALTGLANRRAYDSWLAAAWAKSGAEDQPGTCGRMGLIMLDVDRFKAFNDFYGHAAGDDCLKTIALCLREQLRGTTDLVARLGGEEFAVLLPGLPDDVCAEIAERMRLALQLLELPHLGLSASGMVSISAGVASHLILPGSTPAALFEAADSALYEAKISGRNRVCVATLSDLPALAETLVD